MTSGATGRRAPDDGSASIWVLGCGVLVLVVGMVAAMRGAAVLARHRAESAADLAALAAAGQIGSGGDPCAVAEQIARRNRAFLRGCRTDVAADQRSGTVTTRVAVTIRFPLIGGAVVVATARAGRSAPSIEQRAVDVATRQRKPIDLSIRTEATSRPPRSPPPEPVQPHLSRTNNIYGFHRPS